MNLADRLKADGHEGREDYIFFYRPRDPYGWMSNFSAHGVVLPNPFTGKVATYRTGEHRYQAMKATTLEDHDHVRSASRASETKDRGRKIQLREGWGNNYGDLCWYVMIETLIAKVRANPDLRRQLRATFDRPIYEDSPTDDIWGVRYFNDYRGKNLLGRAWMEVRELLS